MTGKLFIITLFTLYSVSVSAKDTAKFNRSQKAYLYTTSSGVVLGHLGLYSLWYKDYPQSSFHFINDNSQWLQMDKYGHSFSAYALSDVGFSTCQSLGFTKKQSLIYGGLLGLVFQTPIEVFDGFSENWGASSGDFAANILGWGLFHSQQALLDDQVVRLKWSYAHSGFAHLRPNVLGSTFPERVLKDYNAQTYWLSVNLKSLFPKSRIPDYLNLAIGIGAEGMIGGNSNLILDKQTGLVQFDYRNIQRYRTWDLSLDLDLSKIKTKSKLLKGVFRYVNWIKIPFPSLQYSQPNGFNMRTIGY